MFEIKCSKCELNKNKNWETQSMYWSEPCRSCNNENNMFELKKSIKHKINYISCDVFNELCKAIQKFPLGFHSNHEAYGIIKEEFDELWNEIKKHKDVYEMTDNMRKETIQVAAMAIRFILDRYKI